MEENKQKTLIHCIIGSNVRDIVKQANELKLDKNNIISMFVLRDQVYLTYYR